MQSWTTSMPFTRMRCSPRSNSSRMNGRTFTGARTPCARWIEHNMDVSLKAWCRNRYIMQNLYSSVHAHGAVPFHRTSAGNRYRAEVLQGRETIINNYKLENIRMRFPLATSAETGQSKVQFCADIITCSVTGTM